MKKAFGLLLIVFLFFVSCNGKKVNEEIINNTSDIEELDSADVLNCFIENYVGDFAKENEPEKTVVVIEQISDDMFHINLTWKNFAGQDINYEGDFSILEVQNKNVLYEYCASGGFSQLMFKIYLENKKLMYRVSCYKAYLDDECSNIIEEHKEDETYTLIKVK
ncbi:hypothetical protein [Treponema sp.]|uniref:hypothetical protein n=1 Tax=Treponema sp. TaxID=166 RepID=UPI00298E37F1|nr:hypothetical protein [Treponema sp.]MCR5613296.1 hypothetical protein [Treponema sp.]